MNTICVCVFAKAPVAGQVKTRLLPVLSAQQACLVHQHLLEHSLQQVINKRWQTQLWSTDIDHPYIEQLAQRYSLERVLQQGNDLGLKMCHATAESLKSFAYVVIVGTDCPELDAAYISEAIAQLQQGVEVVIGPAEDGGYVLIAMSRLIANVFENMPWGSDRVLDITRQRLQQARVHWYELPSRRDIDRPEDLVFLSQQYPKLVTQ